MAELPPVRPNMGATFTPSQQAVEKIANERSDKSEATALEILKLVVELHKGQTPPTARQLADYAEICWKWTTTDEWPSS